PREDADNAPVWECDISDCGVVCKHGHNQLPATGVCNGARRMSAQLDERAQFLGAPVERRDIMSGLQEIRCHCRAHAAQPDKSDLHSVNSVIFASAQDRCRGAMNSGPTGSVIVSLRM